MPSLNIYNLIILIQINNNATFVNLTFNKSRVYTGALETVFFKWYVDVNITDINDNVLDDVTVQGYNSLNQLDDSNSTNVNGIATLTLMEYYQEGNINYYLVPHTIKAFKNN